MLASRRRRPRGPIVAATAILGGMSAVPPVTAQPCDRATLFPPPVLPDAIDTGNHFPTELELRDLNGDGELDLAYFAGFGVSFSSSRLLVQLASGPGTFAAPDLLLVDGDVQTFEIGDLDGDGLPDLVALAVRSVTQADVIALIANGDGTYQNMTSTITTPSTAEGLAIGDMNGDDVPDLVTLTGSVVKVLVGSGSGSFSDLGPSPAGLLASGRRVTLADLDDDGDLDVVVGSLPGFRVLLGDGAGGLTSQPVVDERGFDPRIADMDGDGTLDLLTADFTGRRLLVHPGLGTGSFAEPISIDTESDANGGCDIGDLDGDGRPDIVFSDRFARDLTVVLDPLAVASTQRRHRFRNPLTTSGRLFSRSIIADIDADGDPDVVTGTRNANAVEVHRNLGDGALDADPAFGPAGPFDLSPIRLGSDGEPGVIVRVSNSGDPRVILRGDGSGGLTRLGDVPSSSQVTAGSESTGDLDGDGVMDLVGVRSGSLVFWSGNADGSFDSPVVVGVAESSLARTAVIDVDASGGPDIVVWTDGFFGELRTHLNLGGGTFAVGTTIPLSASFLEPEVGDFDGDGLADVAATDGSDFVLERYIVRRGLGDGAFGPEIEIPVPGSPLLATDFDGDGRDDLILGETGQFSVALAQVDGTFGPTTPIGFPSASPVQLRLLVDDFDGDGSDDIMALRSAGTAPFMAVAFGDGAGGISEVIDFGGPAPATALADLDGDGRQDLVRANGAHVSVTLVNCTDGDPDPVPGDVDGDGVVDLDDVIAVLADFGVCSGCPTDLDGNGIVGILDLIIVLANFTGP